MSNGRPEGLKGLDALGVLRSQMNGGGPEAKPEKNTENLLKEVEDLRLKLIQARDSAPTLLASPDTADNLRDLLLATNAKITEIKNFTKAAANLREEKKAYDSFKNISAVIKKVSNKEAIPDDEIKNISQEIGKFITASHTLATQMVEAPKAPETALPLSPKVETPVEVAPEALPEVKVSEPYNWKAEDEKMEVSLEELKVKLRSKKEAKQFLNEEILKRANVIRMQLNKLGIPPIHGLRSAKNNGETSYAMLNGGRSEEIDQLEGVGKIKGYGRYHFLLQELYGEFKHIQNSPSPLNETKIAEISENIQEFIQVSEELAASVKNQQDVYKEEKATEKKTKLDYANTVHATLTEIRRKIEEYIHKTPNILARIHISLSDFDKATAEIEGRLVRFLKKGGEIEEQHIQKTIHDIIEKFEVVLDEEHEKELKENVNTAAAAVNSEAEASRENLQSEKGIEWARWAQLEREEAERTKPSEKRPESSKSPEAPSGEKPSKPPEPSQPPENPEPSKEATGHDLSRQMKEAEKAYLDAYRAYYERNMLQKTVQIFGISQRKKAAIEDLRLKHIDTARTYYQSLETRLDKRAENALASDTAIAGRKEKYQRLMSIHAGRRIREKLVAHEMQIQRDALSRRKNALIQAVMSRFAKIPAWKRHAYAMGLVAAGSVVAGVATGGISTLAGAAGVGAYYGGRKLIGGLVGASAGAYVTKGVLNYTDERVQRQEKRIEKRNSAIERKNEKEKFDFDATLKDQTRQRRDMENVIGTEKRGRRAALLAGAGTGMVAGVGAAGILDITSASAGLRPEVVGLRPSAPRTVDLQSSLQQQGVRPSLRSIDVSSSLQQQGVQTPPSAIDVDSSLQQVGRPTPIVPQETRGISLGVSPAEIPPMPESPNVPNVGAQKVFDLESNLHQQGVQTPPSAIDVDSSLQRMGNQAPKAIAPEVLAVPAQPEEVPPAEIQPDTRATVPPPPREAPPALPAEPTQSEKILHEVKKGESHWKNINKYALEKVEGFKDLPRAEQNKILNAFFERIEDDKSFGEKMGRAIGFKNANLNLIHPGDKYNYAAAVDEIKRMAGEVVEKKGAAVPVAPEAPAAAQPPVIPEPPARPVTIVGEPVPPPEGLRQLKEQMFASATPPVGEPVAIRPESQNQIIQMPPELVFERVDALVRAVENQPLQRSNGFFSFLFDTASVPTTFENLQEMPVSEIKRIAALPEAEKLIQTRQQQIIPFHVDRWVETINNLEQKTGIKAGNRPLNDFITEVVQSRKYSNLMAVEYTEGKRTLVPPWANRT